MPESQKIFTGSRVKGIAAYSGGGFSLIVPTATFVPAVDFRALTGGYTYDAGGIIGTDPYVSAWFGENYAAGQYFALPSGVWSFQMSCIWDSNLVGRRFIGVVGIDDRVMDDGVDELICAPTYGESIATTGPYFGYYDASKLYQPAGAGTVTYQQTSVLYVVTQQMVDFGGLGGWKVAPSLNQNSGGDRTVTSLGVQGFRIGDA